MAFSTENVLSASRLLMLPQLWMLTSAGGMPGPKVQLLESSIAGFYNILPRFLRQVLTALFKVGPHGCLSAGVILWMVRRMVLRRVPLRLDGKLVLVNGATSRLGYELSRQLLCRGANVIMVGPKGRPMEGYKTQMQADFKTSAAVVFTRECDCRDGKAVEAMARDLMGSVGSPDIVLHIADGAYSSLSDLSYEEIRDSFEEAMMPMPFLARSFVKSMILRRAGALVLVQAALSAVRRQHATLRVAAAWGLRGLVGALQADLDGTGVDVQEVILPHRQDARGTAADRAAVCDAADILTAIELRRALSFAGVPSTMPEAAYPLLFHLIILSLARVAARPLS